MGEEGHASALTADAHPPAEQLHHKPHAEDHTSCHLGDAEAWNQNQHPGSWEQQHIGA